MEDKENHQLKHYKLRGGGKLWQKIYPCPRSSRCRKTRRMGHGGLVAGNHDRQGHGHGICYPENYGALCAAMKAGLSDYAEGDGVPNTTCGYARNCIGYTRKENSDHPEDAPGGVCQPLRWPAGGL